MNLLYIFSTLLSFLSVQTTTPELLEFEGKVVEESSQSIPSKTIISNDDSQKKIIKYSCLGATQYYIKLTVVNNDNDSNYLLIEVNHFFEKYKSNELLNSTIRYKAYNYSNLIHSKCGYNIPYSGKYVWLNEEFDNFEVVTNNK